MIQTESILAALAAGKYEFIDLVYRHYHIRVQLPAT